MCVSCVICQAYCIIHKRGCSVTPEPPRYTTAITQCACSLLDRAVHLRTTRAFLLELEKQVSENASLIATSLPHINALLHNAVLACKTAVDKSSTLPPSFTNKQDIPPHKNSEHQWKFTKTNKTAGRKRKGNALQ